eukprot:263740_1
MATFLKMFIIFVCVATLIVAEPKKASKEKETVKQESKSSDYSSKIGSIESELSKINININEFEKSTKELSKLQTELTKISQRLKQFEDKQSDLVTVQGYVDLLNNLVNELSSRVDQIEIDQTSKADTSSETYSADLIKESIKKTTDSMDREISDNKRRLEIMEEIFDENDIKQMQTKQIEIDLKIKHASTRNNKHFEDVKNRFNELEEVMVKYNKHL